MPKCGTMIMRSHTKLVGRKCGLPHPAAMLPGIVISKPIKQSLKHCKYKNSIILVVSINLIFKFNIPNIASGPRNNKRLQVKTDFERIPHDHTSMMTKTSQLLVV